MKPLPRRLTDKILFALQHHPIVFLNGPRQAGKSTLVKNLSQKAFPANYVSFDNVTQMAAATSSPHSFLTARQGSLIIDEVQIVPELFRELKVVVDEIRLEDKAHSNGRFLLTGSANIMALPKLSQALVGRMSIKTLYSFSTAEVLNSQGDFISALFNTNFSDASPSSTPLNTAIRMATFPEISGKDQAITTEWFDSYLATLLQRDVRMLVELEKIAQLPNLLRILATRVGGLMNDAAIARDAGLNAVTSKHYRGILQAMFLTVDIPPWHRNIGKRLVKSPKGYLSDTLLLCHLLDCQLDDMQQRKPNLYSHVIENFVATELIKWLSFSRTRAKLYHFRSSDGKEVDFVLERPDGSLAAIEVKASERIDSKDFNGMKTLKELTGDDFICGIVLYPGKDVVPFGNQLFAIPLKYLWR